MTTPRVAFSPTAQLIDLNTGRGTAHLAFLIQFFIDQVNGSGSVLTVDGAQTLTNKTLSGANNTFTNIPTTALASRTGGDARVVTGTAGADGTVMLWNTDGDAVAGDAIADYLKSATAALTYLTIATAAATYLSQASAASTYLSQASAATTYLPLDGSVSMSGPLQLPSYAVASLPTVAPAGQVIYVPDESGGPTLAFSDGTDWKRVSDLAVVT